MSLSQHEFQALYDQTVVVREPRFGIVCGYHELPYICIGESTETGHRVMRIKGTVHVSPRFVLRPPQYEPSYEEIFGEEYTDTGLVGRIFGFVGFRGRPVDYTSEHLEVKSVEASIDRVLSETLDDLERQEDITTGVIISPNPQYFPVSIERFIASVLEDEFRV